MRFLISCLLIIILLNIISIRGNFFDRKQFFCIRNSRSKKKIIKCRGCNCSVHCNMESHFPVSPNLVSVSCVHPAWKRKTKRMCLGQKSFAKMCRQSNKCPYSIDELVNIIEKETVHIQLSDQANFTSIATQKPSCKAICEIDKKTQYYKHSCKDMKMKCQRRCILKRYVLRKC